MRSRFALLTAGLLSLAGVQQAQAGVVIDFPSFAAACSPGSGLTCVGSTSVAGGNTLRLTPANTGQAGAGYSTTAITLGAGATFSTTFQFRFTQTGGIDPADGITFVVSKATSGLGSTGGGLGYQGVGNSVAVEFDTYNNGEAGHSNHVAVDVNGVLNNYASASPYGQLDCTTGNNIRQGCMSNGDIWSATINYDGSAKLLDVFLQDGAGVIQHLISGFSIDLAGALGTNDAFVGFTAGTGAGYENQDILNWRLANDTSLGNPNNGVPEPASLALLTLAAGAALSARRRRA
jgi:hypothetical protein